RNGQNFEKSRVEIAMAKVTAGLMYASGLPHAMAVKTPITTAKAQPAAMASHPAPSALERLRSTFATTPLPNRIRTAVPINSPKHFAVIVAPCRVSLSRLVIEPGERSCDGFLPEAIHLLPLGGVHMRLPGAIDG